MSGQGAGGAGEGPTGGRDATPGAEGGDDAGVLGRPCILVVDDDEAHRMITERALQRVKAAAGCAVEALACGEDALDRLADLLAEDRQVLVLSDYVMPGLDGLELAARVEQDHPGAPVRFAIFSSMATPPEGRVPAGVRVRFLEKPMELADYRAQLADVVAEWRASLARG